MPVRVSDVAQVLDADRPFRVLLPGGEEHRVEGEWTRVLRPGQPSERRRLSLPARWRRRLALGWRRWRVSGYRGRD